MRIDTQLKTERLYLWEVHLKLQLLFGWVYVMRRCCWRSSSQIERKRGCIPPPRCSFAPLLLLTSLQVSANQLPLSDAFLNNKSNRKQLRQLRWSFFDNPPATCRQNNEDYAFKKKKWNLTFIPVTLISHFKNIITLMCLNFNLWNVNTIFFVCCSHLSSKKRRLFVTPWC